MKISKFIAILGAVFIIVAFFLTWVHVSVYGITVGGTGYGIATGRPAGIDVPSTNLSNYDTSTYEGYIKSLLEDSFGPGAGQYSGMMDSFNKMLSDQSLFLLPAFGILVLLMSIFGMIRPSKYYGVLIILLTIALGVFLGYKFKAYSSFANLGKMVGSLGSILGLDEFMPSYKIGIGLYGTILGMVLVILAGIMSLFMDREPQSSEKVVVYHQSPMPNEYFQHPSPWQHPYQDQQAQQPQQLQQGHQSQQWQPPSQALQSDQWQQPQQAQQPQQWQPPYRASQPQQWQPPKEESQGPVQGWRKIQPPRG